MVFSEQSPPDVEPSELATQLEAIAARARTLAGDGSDDAAVRDVIEELHVVTARAESVVRHCELAVRRDTGDEAAATRRRAVQDELVPVLAAGRRAVADALLDPDRPGVAAALARVVGPHYPVVLRLRARTTVTDRDLRAPLSDAINGYTKQFGSARIELDGELRPLSAARKPLAGADAAARRAAFDAQADAVAQLAPTCDALLERAIRARASIAERTDFPSFVEFRYAELRRTDYGPADVARFRAAVAEHIVPIAAQLRAEQAEALSGPGGGALVHPADTEFHPHFAIGNVLPPDELLTRVERVLASVSPELGDVVRAARDDGRIDLPVRAGKAPGAYCATFPDTGLPFVMTNLVGIGRDAKVLVHEFGHASQSALAAPIVPWDMRKPTIEACEIHSMGLELLALPHMGTVFDDPADARAYARMLIGSSIQQTAYYCAGDAFQHELYAPENVDFDATARADAWERHFRAFVPGVDHDAAPTWTRNRWVTVRHFFLFPLYFIDYAIAQVAAWQLWLDALDDPETTTQRYLSLCRRGGTAPLGELLEEAGIANPLHPGTVEALAPRMANAIRSLETGNM